MSIVEIWKNQGISDDSLAEGLLDATYNEGLLSVNLGKLGVIRPNNESLEFFEEELTIKDLEEINDFVDRKKLCTDLAKFLLRPTYGQVSRRQYLEFWGDIEGSGHSLEGFTAFRINDPNNEPQYPAIDGSFIFLIHSDDTDYSSNSWHGNDAAKITK